MSDRKRPTNIGGQAAQGGVATLTERSDEHSRSSSFLLLTENEAPQDARILPAGEYRSAPLEF